MLVVNVLLKNGETECVRVEDLGRYVARYRARIRHKTCPACKGREKHCLTCDGQFVVPETVE